MDNILHPPAKVTKELKSHGYIIDNWIITSGGPDWLAYCHKVHEDTTHYFLVTVAYVTGKWVVEVLTRVEVFNVPE